MAALEPGWAEVAAGRSLRPGAAVRGRPGREAAPWAAPHGPGGDEELLAAAVASPGGVPRASLRGRKRHKLDEAPQDCPPRKKRLAEAALLCPPTPSGARPWAPCPGPPASRGGVEPGPAALEMPCEDMEPMMGEAHGEAARRKLQEIEDRIADEEEEEDGLVEGTASNLPTLVLSDTLKTGLKRDYSGDLTKKIIESMSRPSMELVLWKPLPEFLTKKAKSVSAKNYKPMSVRCPAKPATLEAAFCLQTGKFSLLQEPEMSSDFYSDVEPTGCTEEEMEL